MYGGVMDWLYDLVSLLLIVLFSAGVGYGLYVQFVVGSPPGLRLYKEDEDVE